VTNAKVRPLFVICCLAAISGCSAPNSSDPFEGFWNWQSDPYQCGKERCKMNGTMLVRPSVDGRHSIDLNAFQKLGFASEDSYREIVSVEQSCEGTLSGKQLKLSCRVIRSGTNYLPDSLEIEPEANGLTGHLSSIHRVKVTFRR
jgi:hypothetical protein